jgi:hypothetical protein
MAELMQTHEITVSDIFKNYVQKEILEMEDGQEVEVELISPEGFLHGLTELGLTNLSDKEVQCLMLILIKPELENHIMLQDVQMVMENFGIESGRQSPEKSQKEKGEKPKMNFQTLTNPALSIFYDLAKFSKDHDLKDLF